MTTKCTDARRGNPTSFDFPVGFSADWIFTNDGSWCISAVQTVLIDEFNWPSGNSGWSRFESSIWLLNDAVCSSIELFDDVSARLRSYRCSVFAALNLFCLLYTSPSPRDQRGSRMPSSA